MAVEVTYNLDAAADPEGGAQMAWLSQPPDGAETPPPPPSLLVPWDS